MNYISSNLLIIYSAWTLEKQLCIRYDNFLLKRQVKKYIGRAL